MPFGRENLTFTDILLQNLFGFLFVIFVVYSIVVLVIFIKKYLSFIKREENKSSRIRRISINSKFIIPLILSIVFLIFSLLPLSIPQNNFNIYNINNLVYLIVYAIISTSFLSVVNWGFIIYTISKSIYNKPILYLLLLIGIILCYSPFKLCMESMEGMNIITFKPIFIFIKLIDIIMSIILSQWFGFILISVIFFINKNSMNLLQKISLLSLPWWTFAVPEFVYRNFSFGLSIDNRGMFISWSVGILAVSLVMILSNTDLDSILTQPAPEPVMADSANINNKKEKETEMQEIRNKAHNESKINIIELIISILALNITAMSMLTYIFYVIV